MMDSDPTVEIESLREESAHILAEARMLLPGIQALFGFQTVAVFDPRFEELDRVAQIAHLLPFSMIVLAIALTMAPAAYHRLSAPGRATRQLIATTSNLICAAMIPLMAGLSFDVFVVFSLITGQQWLSIVAGIATFVICMFFWFILPLHGRQ